MFDLHTPPEASRALADIRVEGNTRSAFLLRAALLAGGLYGAGAVSPAVKQAFAQSSSESPAESDSGSGADQKGDLVVINFALTLEYLESTFYEQALDKVSGLSGDTKELVSTLAEDETKHVAALEDLVDQLGGDKAQKPKFDFSSAYGSEKMFLNTSNVLEDTGVSAYNGGAPMLTLEKVKAAAGSIVQVEARHAALIRLERDKDPSPLPFDKASTVAAVTAKIKPFIVEG